MENEVGLYGRQSELPLNIPKSVAIIGCGGVGSWLAMNLALVGTEKVVLVDHDKIEEHNLNRTLFKTCQIGTHKVSALTGLIIERRPSCKPIPIPKKLEEIPKDALSMVSDCEIILDCRDTSKSLPEELEKKVLVVGGYDGLNITLHFNRKKDTVWGSGPVTYRTVPSFLVPCEFIAAVITMYLCSTLKDAHKGEVIKNINIEEFVQNVILGGKTK